ncbi:hypothetical protein ACKUG4_21845 [Pseudomonas glycinae]|uniref:hypothetical protein n=1 Tax=Pseudomonas TaxID=286 RepID=UPI0007E43137|nr:hypothetical protein [Pseudomonas sp. DR 5-09]
MNSPTTAFDKPYLENTHSPTNISKDEFEGGNTALMAQYPAQLNDKVTFVLHIKGGNHYEKLATVAPGGAEKGKVGTKINSVDDWELVGQEVTAYFNVQRNSMPVGQSSAFEFTVSDT